MYSYINEWNDRVFNLIYCLISFSKLQLLQAKKEKHSRRAKERRNEYQ